MSDPPPPPQQPQDESIFERMSRVCQNSVTKCFGLAQNAEDLAKIKYAEHKLETRKKNFGVAYLNLLLDETTSPAQLQSCIDSATSDIAVLKADIEERTETLDESLRVTAVNVVTHVTSTSPLTTA